MIEGSRTGQPAFDSQSDTNILISANNSLRFWDPTQSFVHHYCGNFFSNTGTSCSCRLRSVIWEEEGILFKPKTFKLPFTFSSQICSEITGVDWLEFYHPTNQPYSVRISSYFKSLFFQTPTPSFALQAKRRPSSCVTRLTPGWTVTARDRYTGCSARSNRYSATRNFP
jgi:hypothetical protein